ncbi:hypothetical protein AB0K27_16150, partial [Micromonospora echinospora]
SAARPPRRPPPGRSTRAGAGAPAASEADSGVPAAAEPAAEARDETAPAADTNPAQDGSDGPAPGEPAPDQR